MFHSLALLIVIFEIYKYTNNALIYLLVLNVLQPFTSPKISNIDRTRLKCVHLRFNVISVKKRK